MYNNFFGLHHIIRPEHSYWELSLVTEDYTKSYIINDDHIVNNLRKIINNYPLLFKKRTWGNHIIQGSSYYIKKDKVCSQSQQELDNISFTIQQLYDTISSRDNAVKVA